MNKVQFQVPPHHPDPDFRLALACTLVRDRWTRALEPYLDDYSNDYTLSTALQGSQPRVPKNVWPFSHEQFPTATLVKFWEYGTHFPLAWIPDV